MLTSDISTERIPAADRGWREWYYKYGMGVEEKGVEG